MEQHIEELFSRKAASVQLQTPGFSQQPHTPPNENAVGRNEPLACMCTSVGGATYRDFHAPELAAHLARHLQGDLCGHRHQRLRTAQRASHDALAGDGKVHAQVLLHVVVLVLPVGGQHHHHLTTKVTNASSSAATRHVAASNAPRLLFIVYFCGENKYFRD